METDIYTNPLITRYASKEMAQNFSDDTKFKLWRKLWIALAESEKELGLKITKKQIDELKKYQDKINYEDAYSFEKEVRHDVMSHVLAYGKQAKDAAGIIHLGATSCFVTDNAEIIIIDKALEIIKTKLINVINNLKSFAIKYKDLPSLGFTHLQPAQLTTVGKRATLWMQDLLMDYDSIVNLQKSIKLRGVKGTTGTQASFMDLFNNDQSKVKKLEQLVVEKMGYKKVFGVTGQTYPRKFDYNTLCVLSQIAQSGYKFANDIRILQSKKEIEEPFEKKQIGSSAMAYKRNPMRSERLCSLARFAITMPLNASITSSTQWLERTLDDSANKRIVIAQTFMAVDGLLKLYMNISENLVVYDKVIEKHVKEELPFMATENIIMEGVKKGGNRQELHEEIRKLSMKASENVKVKGLENNLIDLIKNDKMFSKIAKDLDNVLDAKKYTGRASSQVSEFIKNEVNPILSKNADKLGLKNEINV
ncbi:MAG: adenylosuccinate lyase [Clostridia bacterium]|nr:adenylosuccinate lyase [Clostridia bacterium]